MLKKGLSILLVIIMLLAAFPLTGITSLALRSDDWEYEVLDNGTVEIQYYDGEEPELTVPSTIDDKSVTSIKDYAFSWDQKTITIPDCVTNIGKRAFYNCDNLESIIVDSNNMNYSSVNGVLFNKDKTKILCYPYGKENITYSIPNGVKVIGEEAFLGIDSLESVKIPKSVVTIESSAFENCYIKSITIPDSVKTIGECAFGRCWYLSGINVSEDNSNYSSVDGVLFNKNKTKLICFPVGLDGVSYTVPDGVTSIEAYAFEYCRSLENVKLPYGVKSIGKKAFFEDMALSIVIPKTVTSIGTGAFGYEYDEDMDYRRTSNVRIIAYNGSYAQSYAKENGIQFIPLDGDCWIKVVKWVDFDICKTYYYYYRNGVMQKGFQKIKRSDGKVYWHYFGTDGVMRTGWQKIKRGDGKVYYHYFNANGTMRTGWQKIKRGDGKTYIHYFGTNGCMRTGWQSIKNSKGVAYKYYFGTNGCMVTGWQSIKNSKGVAYKYYFHTNGVMLTNWQWIKNSKGVKYRYYFGPNGYMRTGWQKIKASNGKTYKYYFFSNGVNAINRKVKIGTKTYNFNKYGVCTNA